MGSKLTGGTRNVPVNTTQQELKARLRQGRDAWCGLSRAGTSRNEARAASRPVVANAFRVSASHRESNLPVAPARYQVKRPVVKGRGLEPKAQTNQPRATPWESKAEYRLRALKGRNNLRRDNKLSRPFRAWGHVRSSVPRALPWADLFQPFGLNSLVVRICVHLRNLRMFRFPKIGTA